MLPAQFLLRDRQTHHDPDCTDTRVEDPHVPQRIRVRLVHDGFLVRWETAHETGGGAEGTRGEDVREFGSQSCAEQRFLFLEDVLDDDATDDDGHASADVAGEAVEGGGGGHVVGFDVGLESD